MTLFQAWKALLGMWWSNNGDKDLPSVPYMCACLLGDWGSWKVSPWSHRHKTQGKCPAYLSQESFLHTNSDPPSLGGSPVPPTTATTSTHALNFIIQGGLGKYMCFSTFTFLRESSTLVSALKLYLAMASPISRTWAGGGGLTGCLRSGEATFWRREWEIKQERMWLSAFVPECRLFN